MKNSTTSPIALSIAGSDPSGGAGIQCDLKTFMAHQVYGMAIPTMHTVQNSHTVLATHPTSPSLISDQVQHLFKDVRPNAIKIGALSNCDQALAIHDCLRDFKGSIV